jgi:hypothetical protein
VRAVPSAAGHGGALPRGVNPADWLLDVLDGRAPGSAGVDLPAQWAASQLLAPPLAPLAPVPASAPAPGAAAPFGAPPHYEQRALPGLLAQTLLHAQRALLVRARDTGALRLYGLLHVFMACGLSSGFSIYTRGSYEGTFIGPIQPAFLPFIPAALRDFAGAGNVSDLGLQQLCFFITIACGTASGMSSVANLGGQHALFRREASVPWLASPATTARANIRAWERMDDMPELLLREAGAIAQAQGITDISRVERGSDGHLIAVDPSGTTASLTPSATASI